MANCGDLVILDEISQVVALSEVDNAVLLREQDGPTTLFQQTEQVILFEIDAVLTLMQVGVSFNGGGSGSTTYWEPVTNGDVTTPEIVFDDGDVVMEEVPI